MFLSNISIQRPVFTVMVTIAMMTMGILAVTKIGVDLFPDVSFPIVMIRTIYPGAGPEEVEQQVSRRIEEAVSSVNGVDEVRSTSQDSVSLVVVQFKLEADVKASASDVRERIAGIRSQLPKDIIDPIIERLDPTAIPVLTYVITSKRDSAETRRIAEDSIKPKIEAVDGVAQVTTNGGLQREVHIFMDRQKLDSLGLSLAQISQQMAADGFDLPAGHITTGGSELDVKTAGRFQHVEEIGNVVVASLASGAQVRLKDVATIEDGYKEVRTIARYNGQDTVSLEIQKQGGSNTVAVADKVEAAMARLIADLPPDVKVVKAVDTSTYIRHNIEDLTRDLIFGGLMAILVIFIFMLDWRSTLISSLSLPTSVVTTFFAMWYMGFTFNMMSLLALSLSIGLLIDDAVVVRENIYRHMERGKDAISGARDATSEIGLAVTATTFTIVAVFVPVAFMGGLIGRFFKQFGLTIAAAVLVSLFVSFTLDPMMSAHVMKPVGPGHHEEMKRHRIFGVIIRAYDRLDVWYRNLLKWALSHRWMVALAATALFVASLGLTGFMGKEFVSPADRGEFKVSLEMPAGLSFAAMDNATKQAEEAIRRASPEVKSLYVVVGPGEVTNKAMIRVYCSKSEERPGITQWDIQAHIRKELAKLPNVVSSVSDMGLIDGPFVQYPVTLFVRGDDYDKLQEVANKVLAAVKSARGTADADMSFRAGKPETDVRIDRAKAADLGVSTGVIAQTLRLAIQGEVVSKFRANDHDYDVRMQLKPEDRKNLATVEELKVPVTGRRMGAAQGGPAGPGVIELRDVASIVTTTGPATIERQSRQRQIVINANMTKDGKLGDIVDQIQKELDKLQLPAGFTYQWAGQTKDMRETLTNMLIAMAVAILFIFFVLASQFESIVHPFTIMVALPLAIVGAFLMLFLTGKSIGMSSMIGIILLLGLVTKNAILLVDYTNELREKQGMSMIDALLEAGPTRLRPILMTSAAMVLGMLPGALATGEGSEFKAPMAIAVIGGVIASTLLTLVVVPVVYTWLDRFTSRGKHEAGKGTPTGSSGHGHGPTHPAIVEVTPGPAVAAMVATDPEVSLLSHAFVEKA
jgi:hydrophobe/amphiphile efflux-1 (HAE1) family protein